MPVFWWMPVTLRWVVTDLTLITFVVIVPTVVVDVVVTLCHLLPLPGNRCYDI